MSLLEQLAKDTNKQTLTENGALTNFSTLDPLLDFFSRAGAMRERETDAVKLFNKAFAKDKESAVRCLFYLRDIRGGQGERSVFNAIINSIDSETFKKIIQWIPEYGRWSDVPINKDTIGFIKKQLEEDQENMKANKPVSLLAKWLPSENTSSKETREKARKAATLLGLTGRPITLESGGLIPNLAPYRRTLKSLRAYIKILEQKMSAKEWSEIEYDKIPSQAHRKHVKAFKRNDESRYEEFLGKVEKGEKKINSATLFTYEIYDMLGLDSGYYSANKPDAATVRSAEAMWKALPDYTKDQNALVIADVSGSMTGRPMSISTTLAVYFAERNKGAFKNFYMTFTDIPRLIEINAGLDIFDKLNYVQHHNVGYNTNLEAAFNTILNAAIEDKTKQEELPKLLYIISDMEFDAQMDDCDETNFDTAKRRFKEAGYELPHVVFWNVNARRDQSPATKFDNRVTLISGANQSTFQYVLAGKTPMESMIDILNGERYSQIKL